MVLNAHVTYPNSRSYVLKLHRDAQAGGRLYGRLENVASGRLFYFNSAEELLGCLIDDLAAGTDSVQESTR